MSKIEQGGLATCSGRVSVSYDAYWLAEDAPPAGDWGGYPEVIERPDHGKLLSCGPFCDYVMNHRRNRPKDGQARFMARFQFSDPIAVIVLGWTMRSTGVYDAGCEDQQPTLCAAKAHKLWMVQGVGRELRGRYQEPFLALEEDLTPTA